MFCSGFDGCTRVLSGMSKLRVSRSSPVGATAFSFRLRLFDRTNFSFSMIVPHSTKLHQWHQRSRIAFQTSRLVVTPTLPLIALLCLHLRLATTRKRLVEVAATEITTFRRRVIRQGHCHHRRRHLATRRRTSAA